MEVFRSRAGPPWMVQPANRPPFASQMLDSCDVITIHFSPLDQTQKPGPYFWKASRRMSL